MSGQRKGILRMGWAAAALLALPVAAMAQQQQQGMTLFPGIHKGDANGYVSYPEKTFYLKHATMDNDAEETVEALRNMLDPKDRVYFVPKRQAVMIEAPEEQLTLAEKFIHEIDIPRPEVEMRVSVLQVNREKLQGLGPNKDGALSEAAVNQLMQDKDTKVLADEHLRTTSRDSVSLKNGSKVPMATEAAGDGTKLPKISFIDVGVNVEVTPFVHEDGMIDLDVRGEVSAQNGAMTIGGVSEPVIAQTVLDEHPQVHEGETTLLAAARRDNEEQGVVFLVTPRVVWTPAP